MQYAAFSMTPESAVIRLLAMMEELPALVREAQRWRSILAAARHERSMSGRKIGVAFGLLEDPHDSFRLAQANVQMCVAAIGAFVEFAATGSLDGKKLVGRTEENRGRKRHGVRARASTCAGGA
jgi:hypothetical protein